MTQKRSASENEKGLTACVMSECGCGNDKPDAFQWSACTLAVRALIRREFCDVILQPARQWTEEELKPLKGSEAYVRRVWQKACQPGPEGEAARQEVLTRLGG